MIKQIFLKDEAGKRIGCRWEYTPPDGRSHEKEYKCGQCGASGMCSFITNDTEEVIGRGFNDDD